MIRTHTYSTGTFIHTVRGHIIEDSRRHLTDKIPGPLLSTKTESMRAPYHIVHVRHVTLCSNSGLWQASHPYLSCVMCNRADDHGMT